MRTKSLSSQNNIVYDDLLLLMNSIQDYAIIRLDAKGTITSWNKGAEHIKGYTADEVIGKNFAIFYSPEDILAKTPQASLRYASTNGSYATTGLRMRKDGSSFWGDTVLTALYADDGNLRGFVKITRDVTGQRVLRDEMEQMQRRAETAIRQQLDLTLKENADYKYALNESAIVAITDQTGIIRHVNDNFCRISKYSREELIGRDHRIINSGYHDKAFIRDLWKTIASGKIWKGELKNRAKDDTFYWVDTTIVPFVNAVGKPYQYVAIRSDITERKLAEEERNTILESIGDAFFAVDKNWTVTYWNAMAEKVLQMPKNKIINQHLWEVFAGSAGSLSYQKYHEVLETGQAVHFEDYYPPLAVWYEISAYPTGKGLSVYFKDITGRKAAESHLTKLNENLRKQTKDLAASNAELEQFAYVTSHDLQEPLRMITSFLDRLEQKYRDKIDDKGRQYIHFAVDGAKRMRQIILDLLEYSRVGKDGSELQQVSFSQLVDEILILYRKQIEEKKARISFAGLPILQTYKTPVRQALQNLIGNSLKYQPPGGAPVIHITGEEKNDHWVIAISDNGIGIDPAYFEKIFVIFQRLHNKEDYSGTGMGLAITKKIIENLGGNIWVESEKGRGCTFYFTILKHHQR